MSNCITNETALQIILHPTSVSCETMAHVYDCTECQEILKGTVNDILDDCFEVPEKNKWDEFRAFFDHHFLTRKAPPVPAGDSLLGALFSLSANLLPGSVCTMASGNVFDNAKQYCGGEIFCKLIFEASIDKEDERFWNAELLLPDDFSNEAPLSFLVTYKNGLAVENGVLKFSNLQLPIFMGIASTTFGDFRQSLRTPHISVSFANDNDIDGELVFFER